LTRRSDGFDFEDGVVRVHLTADWRLKDADAMTAFEGPRSLVPAAEMAVLLDGIERSLPFLLMV
jgi:hypothetical protein